VGWFGFVGIVDASLLSYVLSNILYKQQHHNHIQLFLYLLLGIYLYVYGSVLCLFFFRLQGFLIV